MDTLKLVDDMFEEGTFAFSDRIISITDSNEELVEMDDEDLEALLASGDFRQAT